MRMKTKMALEQNFDTFNDIVLSVYFVPSCYFIFRKLKSSLGINFVALEPNLPTLETTVWGKKHDNASEIFSLLSGKKWPLCRRINDSEFFSPFLDKVATVPTVFSTERKVDLTWKKRRKLGPINRTRWRFLIDYFHGRCSLGGESTNSRITERLHHLKIKGEWAGSVIKARASKFDALLMLGLH